MTTIHPRRLTDSIAQMRAMIRDCRDRILRLRPAWEAQIVEGTLQRLCRELDSLERSIEDRSEQEAGAPTAASASAAGVLSRERR